MKKLKGCKMGWALAMLYSAMANVTQAQTFNTLVSFDGTNGDDPSQISLVQGLDGNVYGTTGWGGTTDEGTVFKITPEGTLSVVYNFCPQPNCDDGQFPSAGLVLSTDRKFYGTTLGGGVDGQGTVFEMTSRGQLTTLHSFTGMDGALPEAALVQGTNDGNLPQGGLVQAADGNFYGTTEGGGVKNVGTVFKITPRGALTTIYNFCAQTNCADGKFPFYGLILGTDGNFYGTTVYGGADFGTVFTITPDGKLTTLHTFDFTDGSEPYGGLLQATNGRFYGTTYMGGADGGGTVFSTDTGLGPFVTFVRAAGKVGQTGPILGQGFTGTLSVSINGIDAKFTVISDTHIRATVPEGATTGYVTVTTPTGVLISNVPFHVIK